MTRKTKNKNYTLGTFVITLLTLLCAASLFMPIIDGNDPVSIINTVLGKSSGETVLLSKMSIFGIVSVATVIFPLTVAFLVSLWPFNRIKKFVIVFFLSVILLLGFIAVNFLLTAKFSGSKGLGFFVGIISVVAMLLASLCFIRADRADKKQKAVVWYSVLNKIILLICLPLATVMLVFAVSMFDLISNFSLLVSIGVFLVISGTIIAALVAVFASFEKYRAGFLYFLTGACWALGIIFCLSGSDLLTLIIGAVVAIIFAIFWMSLGAISNKYF